MENSFRPARLLLQVDFVYNIRQQKVTFLETPAAIFPATTEVNFSFDDLAARFIVEDNQRLHDFFTPESWAENRGFFTASTDPENYRLGDSASLLIHQSGRLDENTLSGFAMNITPFLPAGMLYHDLEQFAGRLPELRRLTHDLNNQFQIIAGYGSMLEDDLTDPEQKDNATQVMNAVNKSVDLTRELRECFPPKAKPALFVPEKIFQSTSSFPNPAATPVAAVVTTEELNSGILVVDDEPLVQRFLCEMLKRLKHPTFGCNSGGEALEQLKISPDAYKLAVVDMNLPDFNTEVLFDQLKQHNPALKILLISGEHPGDVLERLISRGANGFLQKPTTLKDLGDAIASILAR